MKKNSSILCFGKFMLRQIYALANLCFSKIEIDFDHLKLNPNSLEIAVHPDQRVVVNAPETSTPGVIYQSVPAIRFYPLN